MPSLLFGDSADPRRVASGTFACPQCRGQRAFTRVIVDRAVSLLGVRVPAGRFGEYVECGDCLATYRPEVLATDAAASGYAFMPEYHRAMRRVLALLIIADGQLHEAEVATVQRIHEAVSGTRLSRADVVQEAADVAREPTTAARYLARVLGSLNEHGREQVLRAAVMVSRSDGDVHRLELDMVRRLGAVMRLPPERIDALLADG